jgi:uncharacterized Zn finger protein
LARVREARQSGITVRINPLKAATWKSIKTQCAGHIGSVLELLQGQVSDQVMGVVTNRNQGLFPKPGEITCDYSCPDWATLCKHVAAVLYGVGSRLDNRPELLFVLRDVDAAELIATEMALPVHTSTSDTLADDELGAIFGIDLDTEEVTPSASKAPRQKNAQPQKSPQQRVPSAPRRQDTPAAKRQRTSHLNNLRVAAPKRLLSPRVS